MEFNRSEECAIATDQSPTGEAVIYHRAENVCGFYEFDRFYIKYIFLNRILF